MRREVAAADRRWVVREAAAGWRKAGAIDDATLRAIETAYPDDRRRLGIGLRMLAGLATLVGGLAIATLLAGVFGPGEELAVLILAVGFTVATEFQTGRFRRAQAGAEYATALLAAGFASGLIALLLDFDEASPLLAACCVVWAVASWRWGYALFATVAVVCMLGAFVEMEHGRIAWLAVGGGGLLVLLGPAASVRVAPSQRRALAWGSLVTLAAAYVACNIYVLDELGLRPFTGYRAPSGWARVLAILATAVLPVVVLALGVRRRDRSLLAVGVLFFAASIATLHHYVAVGPLWLRLALGGAACGGVALSLRRWLGAGADRERDGFTAEPLYAERHGVALAQAVATVAALTPEARPGASRAFEGGGGASGGGGATGGA